MKLSTQAMGALMMSLQKSLLEQTDIVPMLLELNFQTLDGLELTVMNPPTVDLSKSVEAEFDGLEVEELSDTEQ